MKLGPQPNTIPADAVSDQRPKSPLSKAELAPYCARRDGVAGAWCAIVIAGVFATVLVHQQLSTPLSFALAFILMGGWQHHLAVLHHEAVHYLLFRNRKLNEWVARYFLGYPVGLTMGYRRIHLAHHRHLGDEGDPDLPNYAGFPARLAKLLTVAARNLSGVSVWSQAQLERSNDTPREIAGLVATQLAVFSLFALAGSWQLYLTLWLLPLATWTKTLTHLRNLVEHVEVPTGPRQVSRWRTIYCGAIEGFFVAPLNFNYHAEHHLYPQVPFYNLARLHRRLIESPRYREQIDIRKGYLRFLWAHVRLRKNPALVGMVAGNQQT